VSSIEGAEKEIFLVAPVMTIEGAAPAPDIKTGDFVVQGEG